MENNIIEPNFICITFVQAVNMTAENARKCGYITNGTTDEGVEVTYEDGHKSWYSLDAFKKNNYPVHNEELVSTCEMMVSEDYKERFKAEYIQLRNRYACLLRMIDRWDNGALSFTPTCPRATYNFQLRAMKEYLDILKIRAKIENIDLN